MKKSNRTTKKTALTVIMSLVLALSLVACGSKKEETPADSATEETSVVQEAKNEPVEAATMEEEEEPVKEEPQYTMIPVPDGYVLAGQNNTYHIEPTSFITPVMEGDLMYVNIQQSFDANTNRVSLVMTCDHPENAPEGTPIFGSSIVSGYLEPNHDADPYILYPTFQSEVWLREIVPTGITDEANFDYFNLIGYTDLDASFDPQEIRDDFFWYGTLTISGTLTNSDSNLKYNELLDEYSVDTIYIYATEYPQEWDFSTTPNNVVGYYDGNPEIFAELGF